MNKLTLSNPTATLLLQPFPPQMIKQRVGAGNQKFDYIGGGDIVHRLLIATNGLFDWKINDLRLIPGEIATAKSGQSYQKKAYWLCLGTLTIPGLGTRDGEGTQVAENEDSPKGASTDAFKRAAMKFGVALDLYRDEDITTLPTYADIVQAMTNEEIATEVKRIVAVRELEKPNMKELGREGLIKWLLSQDAKEEV